MKQATFRIIYFPKPNKYIGFAWNYDAAVMISTTPQESYTLARNQLQQDCDILSVELKWFDGEYAYDANSGQLSNYVSGGAGKSSITGAEENFSYDFIPSDNGEFPLVKVRENEKPSIQYPEWRRN